MGCGLRLRLLDQVPNRRVYTGVSHRKPDLFLVAEYFPGQSQDPERRYAAQIKALEWVRDNWRKYEIRAVLSAHRCGIDSSLLPWQTEPIRILCEEIAADGLLVMAGSGNTSDRTAGLTEPAAPSVFSVGGIVISPDGDLDQAEAFPGSRGTTFEGKWVPEILAPAENIVLPHGTDEEIENHFYDKIDDLPRRYARTLGTSFAGPIALGAAACVWQAHPSWTALDMKTALIASSIKRPQWSDLRAGLVSVEGALAMEATEHPPEPVTSPYQTWSEWRKRSVEYRMDQLSAGDSDQVRDIILSFVGDPLPDAALQPISECLNHPKSEVRAATLCALASKTSEVNPDTSRKGAGTFRRLSGRRRCTCYRIVQLCGLNVAHLSVFSLMTRAWMFVMYPLTLPEEWLIRVLLKKSSPVLKKTPT